MSRLTASLGVLALLFVIGCSGEDGAAGPVGPTGPAGAAGVNGLHALVTVTAEGAGASCAAGGTRVDAGADADADGVLDAAEISSTHYVCDGADGAAGADALVALTDEGAGANCAAGGTRVDSGLDADADGTLDAGEIAVTQYVCHGADGADGATGDVGLSAIVSVVAEGAGANCAAGGTRVDSGVDADRDGTLDTAEIATTRYVCDGTDGADGADGADGVDGLTARIALTPEPPGPSCTWGGTRIDSGLDADADGVLDPEEIAATEYLCNVDTRDPSIVSVSPAPESEGLSRRPTFVVTFSEQLDPATVHAGSLSLLTEWDEPVAATVTWDPGALAATLTPAAQLELWSEYRLVVTPGLRDLEGNALAGEQVFRYWAEIDDAGPDVVATSPEAGGFGAPYLEVRAYFDEELDFASAAAARLQVVDGAGAPVSGDVRYDSGAVVFSPYDYLPAGAYTASLQLIAADWEGNWRVIDRSWSFTIDLPRVVGTPAVTASVVAGGELTVSVPVNPVVRYVELFLGTDADVDGWLYVGGAGGNYEGEGTIGGTFAVPAIPAGEYTLWISAYDENGWVQERLYVATSVSAEFYTRDDTLAWTPEATAIPPAPVTVTDPLPPGAPADLVVTIDSVTPVPGGFEVAYTVRNVGGTDAGAFAAGFYRRAPEPYAIPDVWLDFDGLAAGGAASGTQTFSAPGSAFAIAAFVDVTDSVDEADEGNNAAGDLYGAPLVSASNATPVAIEDHATAESAIAIAGGPAAISLVEVSFDITHTYDGDLLISLVSPAGDARVLVNHRGDWGQNFSGTVLFDFAPQPVWSGSAPFDGAYQPEQPLSALAGQPADGTWLLRVYDFAGGDVGTLNGWSLTIW